MSKDTSNPAFPCTEANGINNGINNGMPGMTLRQWYAGLAMQALITRDKFRIGMDQPTWTAQCKLDAFLMADAMIAEGNK